MKKHLQYAILGVRRSLLDEEEYHGANAPCQE